MEPGANVMKSPLELLAVAHQLGLVILGPRKLPLKGLDVVLFALAVHPTRERIRERYELRCLVRWVAGYQSAGKMELTAVLVATDPVASVLGPLLSLTPLVRCRNGHAVTLLGHEAQ
jgi:hypothetical protein